MLRSFTPAQNFHPIYKQYRLIALALYSIVCIALIIDWMYGGIGGGAFIRASETLRLSLFFIFLLSLTTLELVGFGHKSFVPHEKPSWLAFAIRFALIFSILLFTDFNYSYILVSIIILYSYLAIHERFSFAIICLYTLLFIALGALDSASPPAPVEALPLAQEQSLTQNANPTTLNLGRLIDQSMGLFVMMFFTLLLAKALKQTLKDKDELQNLHESLVTSHAQLQQYSSQVADLAATEERNRLARDIHDSLGHHLTAMNIQLKKSLAYRHRDPKLADEAVTYAQRTVEDALQDIRTSIKSLREEGDAFSFDSALKGLVARISHNDLNIQLKQTGDSKNYGKLSLLTFYRVIQEGLTNIHKHSEANTVSIDIHFSNEYATLELTDNGKGFDVGAWEAHHKQSTSYGLQGLKERLTLLGGHLCINSQPSHTTLKAKLPKVTY